MVEVKPKSMTERSPAFGVGGGHQFNRMVEVKPKSKTERSPLFGVSSVEFKGQAGEQLVGMYGKYGGAIESVGFSVG
jgi:hypothetical protein